MMFFIELHHHFPWTMNSRSIHNVTGYFFSPNVKTWSLILRNTKFRIQQLGTLLESFVTDIDFFKVVDQKQGVVPVV